MALPTLREGAVTLRPIRLRDAKALERLLLDNRRWLAKWEATSPNGVGSFDVRSSIRSLLAHARGGHGLPFVIEYEGQMVGQLNVSSMSYGSLASASLGYWIAEGFAGHGITPTAVALATDHCFAALEIHRMEICIRPENGPSLRVVQKLGFRYEGLRRRFIHIDGDWRDHYCFAVVREELAFGVLHRWLHGPIPADAAAIPPHDAALAARPLAVAFPRMLH